jgi:hypothetical protein
MSRVLRGFESFALCVLLACCSRPHKLSAIPSVKDIAGTYIVPHASIVLVLNTSGTYVLAGPVPSKGNWTVSALPNSTRVDVQLDNFPDQGQRRLFYLQLLECGDHLCMPADSAENYYIRMP